MLYVLHQYRSRSFFSTNLKLDYRSKVKIRIGRGKVKDNICLDARNFKNVVKEDMDNIGRKKKAEMEILGISKCEYYELDRDGNDRKQSKVIFALGLLWGLLYVIAYPNMCGEGPCGWFDI